MLPEILLVACCVMLKNKIMFSDLPEFFLDFFFKDVCFYLQYMCNSVVQYPNIHVRMGINVNENLFFSFCPFSVSIKYILEKTIVAGYAVPAQSS